MRHDSTQLMAARIKWKTHAEFNPRAAASPRIRHLLPAGDGKVVEFGKDSIRALLDNADPAARPVQLEKYLREQVAALLGATAATIDAEQPITNLGLDSLIAAELVTVLDRDLNLQIAGTKLLSGISIRLFAQDILGQLQYSTEAGGNDVIIEQQSALVIDAPVLGPITPVIIPVVAPVTITDSPEVAPTEVPSNGHKTDYGTLEYGDWTTAQKGIRMISSGIIHTLGRISVEGLENIPSDGCMPVGRQSSQHGRCPAGSYTDAAPRNHAHDSLRQNKFLDWFVSDMGQAIYVAEDKVDEASMDQALAVLSAGGLLALAPEGGRSKTGGLLRGRSGVAWLATQADVPVIPLVAWGQEKWRDRSKQLSRNIPSTCASPKALDGRSGARRRDPPAAAPARCRHLGRRLRHRLLVVS